MAKRKTHQTDASVGEFIASLKDESRQKDCRAISKLMSAATGEKPTMWGTSIIGFGKRHYQYANGNPAELCKVGFAPRAKSFAFYLPSYPGHADLIKGLGRYKYYGGCLHVAKLADVDADVLLKIVRGAFRSGAKRAALQPVAAGAYR